MLLAASAVFLLNVAFQAIQAQVLNEVVAVMIGVVGLHCLIGILLIAAFSRPGSGQSRPVAAGVVLKAAEARTLPLQSRLALSVNEDENHG
jgi:hypothetical protein